MVRRGFDLSGDLRIEHDPLYEFVFPFGDLLLFTVLVTAAIAYRRQPELHKRLMLFANIALMGAPLAQTLGTDLQHHGTMKDAQRILRHASIKTTGNVYMQKIPSNVIAAINSRTRAILAMRKSVATKSQGTTCPNVSQLEEATLATA